MKAVRYSLLAILVLAFIGCSGYKQIKMAEDIADSPITVETQFDEDADFSAYSTWTWLPNAGMQSGDWRIDDSFFSTNVRASISGELFKKGYKKVDDSPDLFVNIYAAIDDITEDYIEKNYGGFYEPEYRVDLPEKDKKKRSEWEEGTVFIFVFDAKTRESVWYSAAQAEVAPELVKQKKSEERLKTAVTMMMKDFPKRPEVK
jgi:hypothetical protein